MTIRHIQLKKTRCRNCHEERWDDGLRCSDCGVYQNENIQRNSSGLFVDNRYRVSLDDSYKGPWTKQ